MIDFWNSLPLLMKVLWSLTLVASLIFVIQMVMTFLGMDSDADFGGDDVSMSADADGDGGQSLISFRNFINFFLGFGWTSIVLLDNGVSVPVTVIVAVAVGALLVALVMLLFRWLSGMQQSGNIDVFSSAAGCTGTVYLTVPGDRSSEGKIQVTINNSVREYSAVTDGETLPTGTLIRIKEVLSQELMLIEKIK